MNIEALFFTKKLKYFDSQSIVYYKKESNALICCTLKI